MAYDEELANRLRTCVQGEAGVTEQRMFGGLAFLVNGNLAVAASSKGGLMLRVDPDQSEQLVAEPDVERMVMRGREMDGWLRVGEAAIDSDADLDRWAGYGLAYAKSLPAK